MNKFLFLLFIISLMSIFWINFIDIRILEYVPNTTNKINFLVENVSLGYIVSYIFYILVVYIPEIRDRKHVMPWISYNLTMIVNSNDEIFREILRENNIVYNANLINNNNLKIFLSNINPNNSKKGRDLKIFIGKEKVGKYAKEIPPIWIDFINKNRGIILKRIDKLIDNKYVDGELFNILISIKESFFIHHGIDSNKNNMGNYHNVFNNYFLLSENLKEYIQKKKLKFIFK